MDPPHSCLFGIGDGGPHVMEGVRKISHQLERLAVDELAQIEAARFDG
jgi:hypothetical protein